MKIIISTPNINLNISKVVVTFKRLDYLDTFWTTLFFPFKSKWFQNRYQKEIKFKFLKLIFFKEMMRKICVKLNLKKMYSLDDSIFSANSVSKDLDRKVANYLLKKSDKINIIYSYEDCSKKTFKVAKQNNIKTIYDLTSPYWRFKKKSLRKK